MDQLVRRILSDQSGEGLLSFTSLTCLVVLILSIVISSKVFFCGRDRFNPESKHCYIGGGSQGLGLALACLLAEAGSDVTIVSRSQEKLNDALRKINTFRKSPGQKFLALSYDLSSFESSQEAFDRACIPFDGRCPDYVFCCTGGAAGILGYFIQLSPDQLRRSIEVNLLTAVWTTRIAARKMAKQGVKGRLVLTSSILGFFGLPGYSAYTTSKHALRGLAESLRLEMILYDIKVHCYFPATILSPGFDEEQKCKPELTKEIEGVDEGQSPEKCAKKLIRGLKNDQFLITSDPIGDLIRNSMTGITPISSMLYDPFLSFIGKIGLPIWRRIVERQIKGHSKRHKEEVIDSIKD
ncbi:hypothetical protein BY996DRAFT_7137945 [Phakopsora pachyrhizi]|nr:hypothetical protein BY996DRAFT_7137945 [Phakopsora pachyrhizi]